MGQPRNYLTKKSARVIKLGATQTDERKSNHESARMKHLGFSDFVDDGVENRDARETNVSASEIFPSLFSPAMHQFSP